MFDRLAKVTVADRLTRSPAVAIVGPRQSGKTTLAKALAGQYFDLEQPQERLRLDLQWSSVCKSSNLIALDEAQCWPELFGRLRGAIDADRPRNGRFLLLGSVAPSLMTAIAKYGSAAASKLGLIGPEIGIFLMNSAQWGEFWSLQVQPTDAGKLKVSTSSVEWYDETGAPASLMRLWDHAAGWWLAAVYDGLRALAVQTFAKHKFVPPVAILWYNLDLSRPPKYEVDWALTPSWDEGSSEPNPTSDTNPDLNLDGLRDRYAAAVQGKSWEAVLEAVVVEAASSGGPIETWTAKDWASNFAERVWGRKWQTPAL